MPYRSLLVYLSDDPRTDTRVDIAIRLAQQLEAHLVGLAATGRVPLTSVLGPALLGTDTLTTAIEQLAQQAQRQAQRFRNRCTAQGLKSCEAVVDDDDMHASVARHSHCSDLVVIGQADPAHPGHGQARTALEQVVLYSARPTLVVPYVGAFETVGERVLLAWNDSREAARALADALPLLTRAKTVQLLQCNTPLGASAALRQQRLNAVQQWLTWHGVEAQVHIETTTLDVGNTVLSRAADLCADLIVMGAYGHSRWSERVLGGATRTLLSDMTVPVLMSH